MVQQIQQKSTDFLKRIIVPVGGRGGVTPAYVCPHCHSYPLEDYIWWVSTKHGDNNNNNILFEFFCFVGTLLLGGRGRFSGIFGFVGLGILAHPPVIWLLRFST